MNTVSVGDIGTRIQVVTPADTAVEVGSGDVPVLATPRIIAWMEAAAVAALHNLPGHLTSVGIHIAVDHHAPTLVDATVRAQAEVRTVDGNRVEFEVRAFEGDKVVAGGAHARMIVDRGRFLAGAGVPAG